MGRRGQFYRMSLTPPAWPKPLRRGEGPALSPLVPRGERSPRTLIVPCALEPPSGPLTPSLSPSEGERVPEGRERGVHGQGENFWWSYQDAPGRHG